MGVPNTEEEIEAYSAQRYNRIIGLFTYGGGRPKTRYVQLYMIAFFKISWFLKAAIVILLTYQNSKFGFLKKRKTNLNAFGSLELITSKMQLILVIKKPFLFFTM